MYSAAQLRRGIRSPNLFLREVNRLYHRRLNAREYNTGGIDIFREYWDNLIVLDACRFDMFEQQSSVDGTLEARYSRGSSTREWLTANFTDRTLHDTVYVTANPQLYRHRELLNVSFHHVDHVWQTNGWDDRYQTVLPETTTEHALEAAERYPNKRLLIHYIQPHYPFLSVEGGQPFDNSQLFLRPDQPSSWNQIMTGELNASREEIWAAYRRTLEVTLPHVNRLIDTLGGKTVVTADHGNMVGERARPLPIAEWGHPRGVYTDELVKIPWCTVDGERREIVAEEPTTSEQSVADDVVSERLAKLGYV